MFLNEVKLIGNLGGDATKFNLPNGSKVKVSFQLATQRSWKNKEGQYETRTDWHRIVVWGGLTKFAEGLKKGERVLVTGELRSREYEKEIGNGNKKQDVTMYVTEIYASQLRRMDRRKDSNEPIDAEEEAPADHDGPV